MVLTSQTPKRLWAGRQQRLNLYHSEWEKSYHLESERMAALSQQVNPFAVLLPFGAFGQHLQLGKLKNFSKTVGGCSDDEKVLRTSTSFNGLFVATVAVSAIRMTRVARLQLNSPEIFSESFGFWNSRTKFLGVRLHLHWGVQHTEEKSILNKFS